MNETVQALNEAVNALGDIPAENTTEQQQEAYRRCLCVRDELTEGEYKDEVSINNTVRDLIVVYAIIAGIINWLACSCIMIILFPDAMRRFQYRFGFYDTILGKCLNFIVGIPLMIILTPLLLIVPLSVGLGLLHKYRTWKQKKEFAMKDDRIVRRIARYV